MRCLTLGGALRDKGASVVFVCRRHDGHLCALLEQQGFKVVGLPTSTPDLQQEPTQRGHRAWLGASWQDDADQTRAAIAALGTRPEWLIVDHYSLDERWERMLRPWVARILVIDDLADRRHDCDMLLDQNLVENIQLRYQNRVPAECSQLLGPRYALLQPVYAELHESIPAREGPIRTVLISFGGPDEHEQTEFALRAFLDLGRQGLRLDVVIGHGNPRWDSIVALAFGHPHVHLHQGVSSLAPLMAQAELAIGAAGSSSWERLCMALPTLLVTAAENQRGIAAGLHQHALARWLGHWDDVHANDLKQAITELLGQEIETAWSLRCREAVDGLGARRVSAALAAYWGLPMTARRARLADEAQLFEWAGVDKDRRSGAASAPMTAQGHRQWLHAKLRDLSCCRIFIVETEDGVPVGQATFEKVGTDWCFRHGLAAPYRREVIEQSLFETALCGLRGDQPGVLSLAPLDVPGGAQGLRINVCADAKSWINPTVARLLRGWIENGHHVSWVDDAAQLPPGDICFLLSYGRIVSRALLSSNDTVVVVHASDLPKGRGWSPLTWQILEGKHRIAVSLFEAAEAVDSGPVYRKVMLQFTGAELIDELRDAVAAATLDLCQWFVASYPSVRGTGVPQEGEPTYYPRRRPHDSRLDVDQSLRSQFNLLRTVDGASYPAWFDMAGRRFVLKVERKNS